ALHDRMTESVLSSEDEAILLFVRAEPEPLATIDLLGLGRSAIEDANRNLGLALATDEIEHLEQSYRALSRNPTDVELGMRAERDTHHCPHSFVYTDLMIEEEK